MTQPPTTPSPHEPSDWEPVQWEPAGWEPDSEAVEAAIAQHLGPDAEDIHAAVRQAQEQADLISDPHARSIEPEIPEPDVPADIGLHAPVAEKVSVQDVVQAAAAEVDQEIVHDAHHSDADASLEAGLSPNADAPAVSDTPGSSSAASDSISIEPHAPDPIEPVGGELAPPAHPSAEHSSSPETWNAPPPPGGTEQRAPGAQ